MSAYQLPVWVWPAALSVAGGLAAWRGREDERVAAVTVLANWALSMVAFRASTDDTQWTVLVIDAAQFGVFLWIALRSTRYWPLGLAAFGLLQLVTHLAHALDTGISTWAYLTGSLLWSYLMLLAIGYGAWTAPRRYAEIAEAPSTVPGATRR